MSAAVGSTLGNQEIAIQYVQGEGLKRFEFAQCFPSTAFAINSKTIIRLSSAAL